MVAATLARRGLATPPAALAFLHPHLYTPCPPAELPGVGRAASRILLAIQAGEPVGIWGDFDVDGITSATILFETLRALGATIAFVHIPHRQREGHGLHLPTFQGLLARGVRLVVTCDTGITALEAVTYASSRGVDVIVTDHHTPLAGASSGSGEATETWDGDEPPEFRLPPAYAVVTNRLLPPEHPLAGLPGAGCAYLLAQELAARGSGAGVGAVPALDLAALGIVADVAPLIADTRYLLQLGLVALRQTSRPGLQALFKSAGVQATGLTEEHISFTLAPRLNALGRLADASLGVELFTTQDRVRAEAIAAEMETLNAQRQLLCSQVTAGALAQIQRHPELLAEPVLIVGHETWPANVVGIVASRLVEQFGHPAVVLSMPAGEAVRGSARSVPGVDIGAAIAAQGQHLLSFGGHPMAAGLSMAPESLPAFRYALSDAVGRMLAAAPLPPAIAVDTYLDWEEPGLDLAREVARLAPFGAGNPPLCFATRGLHVVHHAALGRTGEHRRLVVADDDDHRRAVLWWHGADGQVPDEPFDLAYTLRTSSFQGTAEVQVEWLAARPAAPSSPLAVQGPCPARTVDHRQAEDPDAVLRGLLGEEPSLEVWAEVNAPSGIAAKNRLQLGPAQALAVWTAPPSRREWEQALAAVRPTKLYLFGHDPGTDDLNAFAQRLAGMVSYCLRTKGGYADLAEMASAAGQTEETVGLGLRWLAARRQVEVTGEDGRGMTLAAVAAGEGKREREAATSPEAALLAARIQGQLAETAAYRKYWLRVPTP